MGARLSTMLVQHVGYYWAYVAASLKEESGTNLKGRLQRFFCWTSFLVPSTGENLENSAGCRKHRVAATRPPGGYIEHSGFDFSNRL